ncbi:MAG: hypothetical protein R2715_16340 [Ilumatobacteraceae bacterium]
MRHDIQRRGEVELLAVAVVVEPVELPTPRKSNRIAAHPVSAAAFQIASATGLWRLPP